MKRKISYIVLIAFVSIGILFLLLNSSKPHGKSGFIRNIDDMKLEIKYSLKIDRHYYFANFGGKGMTLKDVSRPWMVLKTDYNLSVSVEENLKLPPSFLKDSLPSVFCDIQPDKMLFYKLPSRELIVSSENKAVYDTFSFKDYDFDQFCAFSKNSICSRLVQNKITSKSRSLIKFSLKDRKPTVVAGYKIPKQVDGYFCTDGLLQYNSSIEKIVYMFYYRGEFIVLDTNLKTTVKGKTIDTVRTANLNINSKNVTLKNGDIRQETKMTGVPKFINRTYTTDSKFIYIISNLIADNEDPRKLDENEIVDVYSIENGKYIKSFYLPRYFGKRIREFRIVNNRIYATCGEYLLGLNFQNNT